MLKALVKKQISEIFRQYFYNPKTNQKRSKASTVGYVVLFVVLMVGFLGGTFAYLSLMMCETMVSAGAGWLYFCVMGLLSLFLGIFGSVFNTYSGLYLSKDNDFLLSMPIPVSDIMASRLIGVYLMGLMYSGTVSLPAVIVFFITAKQTVLTVLGGLLFVTVISMIVLVLSCALGWCVAKISLKMKNKSFTTVLASLLFIVGYYFFYYKAQTLINTLLANVSVYADKIKSTAYPLYVFGNMGMGNIVSILVVTAVTVLLFALTWYILAASFLKIATSSGKTVRLKEKKAVTKQKSVFGAVLAKEFSHFAASPNYILNCGIGMFMMPAAGIAFYIKGGVLTNAFAGQLPDFEKCLPVFLCCILCMLASMNDTSVPSVSLEGASLGVLQSLPVKSLTVLNAKLCLQVIITAVPMLIASLCFCLAAKAGIGVSIFMLIMPQLFTLFTACFGLIIGLKTPILVWEQEIVPIKQNFGVAVAMFGGWFISVLPALIYYFISAYITPTAFLAVLSVIILAVTGILYRWIVRKGTSIFEKL